MNLFAPYNMPRSSHPTGQAAVPALSFIASLIIGAIAGLIIAFTTGIIWLAIVVGVAAMVLTGIIAAAFYFASDFTRYRKMRQM